MEDPLIRLDLFHYLPYLNYLLLHKIFKITDTCVIFIFSYRRHTLPATSFVDPAIVRFIEKSPSSSSSVFLDHIPQHRREEEEEEEENEDDEEDSIISSSIASSPFMQHQVSRYMYYIQILHMYILIKICCNKETFPPSANSFYFFRSFMV
jgi:hypothetical protein